MKIPITWRKKALLIIDVQQSFIIPRNEKIIEKINRIILWVEYDIIVATITYNEKWSLWEKQIWWTELFDSKEEVDKSIFTSLKGKNSIILTKLTRSAFKADSSLELILQQNDIEEVHIVWYESNDCVFATALESIDLWFYTFVIEEAVETRTTEANHIHALSILNYLNLTNNSKFVWSKETDFKDV